MKPYPETHQQGVISIEQDIESGVIRGDFGIQIAKDGRVWVCIDGRAVIRFKRDVPVRKIRIGTPEPPPPEVSDKGKIVLWRVIGFDTTHGKVIVEDPVSGERSGFYTTTGARCSGYGAGSFGWGENADGEKVFEEQIYCKYVDPPEVRDE